MITLYALIAENGYKFQAGIKSEESSWGMLPSGVTFENLGLSPQRLRRDYKPESEAKIGAWCWKESGEYCPKSPNSEYLGTMDKVVFSHEWIADGDGFKCKVCGKLNATPSMYITDCIPRDRITGKHLVIKSGWSEHD